MKLIEYQAKRFSVLEDIGMQDAASTEGALFVYVLDALGVPFEGEIDENKGQFSREWFEDTFYGEFLLENEKHGWNHLDVLTMIKDEVKNNLAEHYRQD